MYNFTNISNNVPDGNGPDCNCLSKAIIHNIYSDPGLVVR